MARSSGFWRSARFVASRSPVYFPELRGLGRRCVVCWYRAVLPDSTEDVQPLVKVTVRDLDEPDSERVFRSATVPATALGQLRIGAILHDGRRIADFLLPARTLRVVFGHGCTTRNLPPLRRQLRARPEWFTGVGLGGFALRLPLRGRGDLWIPSLEYFSRCYGRSQEVKRILLSCPWDLVEERLFAPAYADEPPAPLTWRIRYGAAASRLVRADAVFLAYVRHCRYAEACAKRLYADLDVRQPETSAEEPSRRRRGIHLDVRPWFLGPVKLKVRGLPLANGGFLALRVDGASAPTYPVDLAIERLVASDDGSVTDADPVDPDLKPASKPAPARRRISADGLPLVAAKAPAWDSPEALLLDTEFEELLPCREVRTVRVERRRGPEARGVPAPDPRQLSGAERYGSDSDTGVALAFSPSSPASEDVLRRVWEVLQSFKVRYPACVRTVDWFTPTDGFQSSLPLGFVRFPLDGPYSSRPALPWVRLQPRVRRPRGFAVFRVGVSCGAGQDGTRHLYVVEVERRPPPSALEKFSGLIFDLERQADSVEVLRDWVDVLRYGLPPRRGVFASLVNDCPGGKAFVFPHISLDNDRVRQETGVRNVLRKMGVPAAALTGDSECSTG